MDCVPLSVTSHIPSTRPVLLLLDNHSSYVNLEVVKLAKTNNIILFSLPPHTSHLYQPLDVAVFRPLKSYFSKLTEAYPIEHPYKEVDTIAFVKMLYDSYEKAMTKQNLIDGFVGACVFPCDKTSGLKKLSPTEKVLSEEKPPSIFSNILAVPKNTKVKSTPIRFSGVLTSEEYIEKAEKIVEEKKKKEIDKNEKKRPRGENKKRKEEDKSQKELVKKQKSENIFCRCRTLCKVNRKSP